MRQVYPGGSALDDAALAALYGYPELGAPPAHWLRANMVASLDGAATVEGRSGGLSNEADQQVFAMLRALAAAGLLDELCLTVSPLLAGPGPDRIVTGGLPMPGGGAKPVALAHVLEDEGYLLCRYVRRSAG